MQRGSSGPSLTQNKEPRSWLRFKMEMVRTAWTSERQTIQNLARCETLYSTQKIKIDRFTPCCSFVPDIDLVVFISFASQQNFTKCSNRIWSHVAAKVSGYNHVKQSMVSLEGKKSGPVYSKEMSVSQKMVYGDKSNGTHEVRQQFL